MVNRFYVLLAMLLLGLMPLAGCQQRPIHKNSIEQLHVMVSIAPQKYFVERIGNEYVTVNMMVPPGAEPHTFEPKPAQLKALSHSSAYMRIRIDFESAWMDKIKAANPKMLIVDTTQGIQRMPMTADYHEEGKAHTDQGENLDPHIWLSPPLVKVQARTIANALIQLDAKHKQVYQANLERFLADIDTLDADVREALEGVKNRKFIVFHPSWGYFARDYGLEMIPIQVGGQEPSAAELGALITKAQQEGIKVVFAEPEFSTQSADTIAREIGGQVLLLNPLSSDWLNNLRTVANTFAKVLSQGRRIHNSEFRSQKSGVRSHC